VAGGGPSSESALLTKETLPHLTLTINGPGTAERLYGIFPTAPGKLAGIRIDGPSAGRRPRKEVFVADLVKCPGCGRPVNPAFNKCPFCNAGIPRTSPPAQARKPDYTAIAEDAIARSRALVPLEFHPAGVVALDLFFNLTCGSQGKAHDDDNWTTNPAETGAIISFGVFFGELIRRELGGQWEEDPAQPDNLLMTRVVLKDGSIIFPVSRALKRMKNGEEDSFESMYFALRTELGVKSSPAEIDGWVRHAAFFEKAGRQDLALLFYERALACGPDPAKQTGLTAAMTRAEAAFKKKAEEERAGAVAGRKEELAGLMEEGRRSLAGFGVLVDGGTPTLVGLDCFIDETFGTGPGAAAEGPGQRTARALGAFLGAHCCRRFRAAWREEPSGEIEKWQVAWPSGLSVSPFAMVGKRLAEGPRSSILQQMAALTRTLQERGDAEDPPEVAADWFAQAEEFAKNEKRLALAVRFATMGLKFRGDTLSRRVQLSGWCRGLGRLSDAAAHVEAALRMDGQSAPAWLELARLNFAKKDAVAAAKAAQRSLALRESLDGHLLSAAAFTIQGRTADALAAFERALDLDPTSIEGLLGMAGMLSALDRSKEALEWLESIAGRSDCEPARSILAALAADKAGEPLKAYSLYSRLKSSQRVPAEKREFAAARAAELAEDPAVLMAEIEKIQDLGGVVKAYERLNARRPELVEPWRERGVGLAMLGRTSEALQCFDKAVSLAPGEPKTYDDKAVTLMRAKRFDDALKVLDEGLSRCPRAPKLFVRRGVVLASLNRNEESLRAFEAAIQADPADYDAWAYKGDIEQRMGRKDAAIASLKHFLAMKPGSRGKLAGVVREQLWHLENPGKTRDQERAGRCLDSALRLAMANRFAEALSLFDEAAAADPLSGEVWMNRGTCLRMLSRFEDALDSYRKAEALLGPVDIVVKGQVECLLTLGRGEEAVHCCDRGLAFGKPGVDKLRHKARTLVHFGRPAEAVPILKRLVAGSPGDLSLLREWADAVAATGES
jgi:tetratricopeptide (TPR) repeat protein